MQNDAPEAFVTESPRRSPDGRWDGQESKADTLVDGKSELRGGVVGLMSCAGREMSSMERDEGGGGFVREWERRRGEA